MSALLTTTMPYARTVNEEFTALGIRDKSIIIVVGAPLNSAFAWEIEADYYCRDAAEAVCKAKKALPIGRSNEAA